MEMGYNMRYGIASFSEVADDFDKLMKTFFEDRNKMIYVKPTGILETRINAQNIIALADSNYRAFTSNSEYFGLTHEEAWRIERYLMLDEKYDSVVELHGRYPEMDKEHGTFMKRVNQSRRVKGALPMDKNGKIMKEDSEEYKKVFGL